MKKQTFRIPKVEIAKFCQKHHIRKLSLFGSRLTGSARQNSDVDFLVEFEFKFIPGLIRLAGMEVELSEILGRKVDLRTKEDLSPYFRSEVLETAEVQYAA